MTFPPEPAEPAPRPDREGTDLDAGHYRMLVAAISVSIAGSLPGVLTGALGVQIQVELGFTQAGLGIAIGLSAAAIGLSSVVLGRLVDDIGWRRSIRIASTGSILVLLGIAVVASTWIQLSALIVAGGIAFAIAMPASNVVLAEEMPWDRLGLTMGIKQTAGSATTLLAGVAVPTLGLTLGWRWAFVAAMVLPLIALLAVPAVGPQVRSSVGLDVPETTSLVPDGANSKLALSVVGAAGMIVSNATSAFLVITLVDVGIPEGTAGIWLALGSVGSLSIQVLAGWLIDVRGTSSITIMLRVLALAAVGGVLAATRQPPLVVLGGLAAMSGGRGWQGQYFHHIVTANPGRPGSATGTMIVGMAVGAAVGPAAFGALADLAGHWLAWSVISATASGAIVLGVLAGGRGRVATSGGS